MTANSSQMKERLSGNSKVAKQQGNAHMHILLFLSLPPLLWLFNPPTHTHTHIEQAHPGLHHH